MTEYTSIKFPAAYYASGKAYAFLRQHSDAVAMVKLGLEMLAVSSSCQPLNYPGTKMVIEDSKTVIIEVRITPLLSRVPPYLISQWLEYNVVSAGEIEEVVTTV